MTATSSAFYFLHRNVQKVLWDMKWSELRPIQESSILCIYEKEKNILIAAPTAGGKTEAAFIPVISKISEKPEKSVQALYVGPLKALINDQFNRLESLCSRSDIKVTKWHGDASASDKKKLIDKPEGILLITPESLEGIVKNKTHLLGKLFSKLEFIVIDEAHIFMMSERGVHLISLLKRIQCYIKTSLRAIGLSATIGEMNGACQWISQINEIETDLIFNKNEDQTIAVKIYGYLVKLKEDRADKTIDASEATGKTEDFEPVAIDIFKAFKGKTNLIFGNSKSELESYADELNQICNNQKYPNEFLIHHGSLSKEIRENAEICMKSGRPFTCFCTNTLELGIDIGYVDTVGQLHPPHSVSSLIQRVGRSGRRDGSSAKLRFYIQEFEQNSLSSSWDTLYLELIQAIAMVELLLEGKCESPDFQKFHYSTFLHQILSVLSQTGGATADGMFNSLVLKGCFGYVSKDDFIAILRNLKKLEIIEQTPQGEVILAPKGEKITSHYDFYAVFATPQEYKIINTADSRLIGTLPLTYPVSEGEHIILAGKRWQVVNRNDEKLEILVKKARGAKAPIFSGCNGNVSEEIRAKMKSLLFSNNKIVYLDSKAMDMYQCAKDTAARLNLNKNSIIQSGKDAVLFTWTSSIINSTIYYIARSRGLSPTDIGIGLSFSNYSKKSLLDLINDVCKKGVEDSQLLEFVENKQFDKYDSFLPESVINKAFIKNYLDIK